MKENLSRYLIIIPTYDLNATKKKRKSLFSPRQLMLIKYQVGKYNTNDVIKTILTKGIVY